MKRKISITNTNSKGELHGYQEWYDLDYRSAININGLWVRGHCKYSRPIGSRPTGYIEFYQIKEMRFYIN